MLEVTLDSPHYQEGQIVKGHLRIHLKESLTPHNIIIKLKAKEEVYWKLEDIFKGRKRRREYQARVTWFNHKSPFYQFSNDLAPGTHTFPFYFRLDESHPQTYHYVNTKKKNIRPEEEVDLVEEEFNPQQIGREVAKQRGWMPGYPEMDFSRKDMDLLARAHATTKIKFDFQGMLTDGSHFHYKTSKFMDIVQSAKRVSQILHFPVKREGQSPLTTCFCMKRGIVSMRVDLARNHYLPGDDLVATIRIDNSQCSSSMSGINLKLRQLCCIKNHDGVKNVYLSKDQVASAYTNASVGAGSIQDGIEAHLAIPDIQNSVHLKIVVCCYEVQVVADYGAGNANPRLGAIIWIYKTLEQMHQIQSEPSEIEPIELIWSKNLYYDIDKAKSKYNLPVWQAGLKMQKQSNPQVVKMNQQLMNQQ